MNRDYKRIVVISNMYPSASSPNFGVFVKRFVEGLKGVFEIKLIVIKGRKCCLIQKAWSYSFFYFKIIVNFLMSKKTDLFYVHYANHSLLPLRLLPNSYLSFVIVNFHGGDLFPENKFAELFSRYAYPIIRKVKGIVVPSEYFKREVVSRLNVSKDKVFVSPSGGVDCDLFIPSKSKNTVNKFVNIGYVGRLDKGKGFNLLIDAFDTLISMNIKCVLHVVGGGAFFNKYKTQIFEMGYSNLVVFYGMQPQNKLPSIFNKFDVFIFPSVRESLGLVGIESLACGVPVIGSDIGGISSYVENGQNGYLFEANSSKELTNSIIRYINLSVKEKKDMKIKARKSALVFDAKKVQKELVSYLKSQVSL